MSKASSGKKVILNSVIYSVSGLFLKCFSFFLLPLYTAYLTTEDYGITSVATSFIGTMSYVVSFSLYSAIKRFYVDLKDKPDTLKRFYGSVCSFVFLSGLVFAALFTIFRDMLSELVFSGVDFYPLILVCIISLVFECQHTIFDSILRGQQKALKCSILSMVFFFVTLLCNLLFVVMLKLGALGSLLATMTGYIVYTVYFVVEMSLQKTIFFCLDWSLLADALKYSVPIMPHNLSTQIATLVSKVLIGGADSFASLGVYSIASQFGNIADTVQGYVSKAYGPWLYEKLQSQDDSYKSSIRKISSFLSSVIGLFLVGIALFAHDYIVLLVDAAYVDAWKFVPLVVLVYAIKTMYYFFVEILFYHKKASKLLFTATLTGSIINVLLSFYLIPVWGAYGSILADMVSMVIRVAIVVAVSSRFDNIGLRVGDFIGNIIVVALFVFAGLAPSVFWFGNEFSLLNFGYKWLVILVYVTTLTIRHWEQIAHYAEKIKHKVIGKGARK